PQTWSTRAIDSASCGARSGTERVARRSSVELQEETQRRAGLQVQSIVHRSLQCAETSDLNPTRLWLPSQKGLFADCPQRQRKIGSSVNFKATPFESTSLIGPFTSLGPSFNERISISVMSLAPFSSIGAALARRLSDRQPAFLR